MMLNSMKISLAKTLAREVRYFNSWELITCNFYQIEYKGYHLYKRKTSLNYFQYIVRDEESQCTFQMYEKEKPCNPQIPMVK